MAAEYLTYVDFIKMKDPDGSMAEVAEVLTKVNPVLEDMPWIDGNLPTGNQVTVRSDLPYGTWIGVYQGIEPSKSGRTQVVDTVGRLADMSQVDARALKVSGNSLAARLDEDSAFQEGMSQTMSTAVFYGNPASDPNQPMGLAARYPYYDSPGVVNAGGSGTDVYSMWLVVWDPKRVCGFTGMDVPMGFQMEDYGKDLVPDGNGNYYPAYRTWFEWELGVCLKDWRQVARLCNIESSGSTGVLSLSLLVDLVETVENIDLGRAVIYAPRVLVTYFKKLALANTSSTYLTMEADMYRQDPIGGGSASMRKIPHFLGVPIKRCDALVTETALTATP